MFTPHTYSCTLDITSAGVQASSQALVNVVKPLIDSLIIEVLNGTFDYSNYQWGRNPRSGLSNKAGLYLIINERTQRIYLGSTKDLSQRKGDHSRGFRNPNDEGRCRPSPNMRVDLANGSPNDFHYVPLVIINPALIQSDSTLTISNFLDLKVESVLLDEYLSPSHPHVAMFYNSRPIGQFQFGQQVNRSPLSGQAPVAVAYSTLIAWSSVSLAAYMLDIDRKAIRVKRDNGTLTGLTSEQFSSFSGTTISTQAEAEAYMVENPQMYSRIRSALVQRRNSIP